MKQFASFIALLLLSHLAFSIIKPGDQVDVKVFLDSREIDATYLKENFHLVNYVVTPEDANVHLLGTSRRTGSGGKEYAFYFIGLNDFQGVNDTLYYFSSAESTMTETREGYSNIIKMGLTRYLAKASHAVNISFGDDKKPQSITTVPVDKWRNWVFGLNANGRMNGQKTNGSHTLNFSVNGTKTSDDWRVEFLASNMNDQDWFKINDSVKIVSKKTSGSITNLTVKSIGKRMAIGLESSLKNSSYSNLNMELAISPAFEYNVFPYSESSRKQLRFSYYIGYNGVKYQDTTIFNKIKEDLFKQRLSVIYMVKEKWGSLTGSMIGSTYLHDLQKNNLSLNLNVDFRVWRGLSINMNTNYSLINDQLSLKKGNVSLDQQLLLQRQLATSYTYRLSAGLRYTFGSMYNNTVNQRLSTLNNINFF